MQVWNLLHAACWKCRTQKSPKSRHLRTVLQSCQAISSQLRHVSTTKKKLVKQQYLLDIPDNMVNFGPLAAEIDPVVWGTPANFNLFHVLAALLHGSQVLGISQTLRHWTEGATYIRQGGHHVGHWPTFLVFVIDFTTHRQAVRSAYNRRWYLSHLVITAMFSETLTFFAVLADVPILTRELSCTDSDFNFSSL